ncbi:mannose-6-phosphate isomerase, class I [Vibrio penaeicida]|uniref:mannose-6-phosphate isomerase n=3 Tax=Vibrio penaeicida TaxID=104609 RepID=A0AAV5NWF8_9VIBR|nr:mannose-6-phosphate isomerase, class I [Vibrio penaeicida]GLQ74584.1 mannose-6-phosphate isomerase [Vibrio penaeicida]
MIYKLINTVKNFDWGSKTAFNELYNIPNEQALPQAELWMGTHPNGGSKVSLRNGKIILLSELISESSKNIKCSNELPFLMKILAAQAPLSIQVHPDKESAILGFERENEQGLSLSSPTRNYKDSNHKPELIYAISPYLSMNGFRSPAEIFRIFSALEIEKLSPLISKLMNDESEEVVLHDFFVGLLSLENKIKYQVIKELDTLTGRSWDNVDIREAMSLAKKLISLYKTDIGVFSPLFLNIIRLEPGEAMFLNAKTPHSYVQGVGVEVMANSDNVLRAGLTSKYIDIPELISNTNFISTQRDNIKVSPIKMGEVLRYPVPVNDFCFEVIHVQASVEINSKKAEILLCLEGRSRVFFDGDEVLISKGESVFLSGSLGKYNLMGAAKLVRVYV